MLVLSNGVLTGRYLQRSLQVGLTAAENLSSLHANNPQICNDFVAVKSTLQLRQVT